MHRSSRSLRLPVHDLVGIAVAVTVVCLANGLSGRTESVAEHSERAHIIIARSEVAFVINSSYQHITNAVSNIMNFHDAFFGDGDKPCTQVNLLENGRSKHITYSTSDTSALEGNAM